MKEFTTDMLEQIVGIEYPPWCLNYRHSASPKLMEVIYADLIKEVLTSNDIFIRLDHRTYGVPLLGTEPIKNIKNLDDYVVESLVNYKVFNLISVRGAVPFVLEGGYNINVISASSEVEDEVIALAKKVASKYNQDTIFKVAKQRKLLEDDILDYKSKEEKGLTEYLRKHNYRFVHLIELERKIGGKISFDGQEVLDEGNLATWRVELADSAKFTDWAGTYKGATVAESKRAISYEDLRNVGLLWHAMYGTDVSFYTNDKKMSAFFAAYDALIKNIGMKIIRDSRGNYTQQQLVKQ